MAEWSWDDDIAQHYRKRHHPDPYEAERERRRLAGINPHRSYARYRCPKCGGWLVGARDWSER